MTKCKEENKSSYPKRCSIKYSLPYEGGKQTLIIDRLELTMRSTLDVDFNYLYITEKYNSVENTFTINDRVHLRKDSKHIERFYLHSFDVLIDGNPIATLHTNFRLETKNIKLQFNNEVFYTANFYDLYNIIIDALPIQLNNIKYLEIALDSVETPLQKIGKIYPLSSSYIHCETPVYQPVTKINVNLLNNGNQFIIGEKKTGKTISIYNKTKELKANNNKLYISAFHKENGLSGEIQRVEVRLTNDYIKKHFLIELKELTNPNTLLAIFSKSIGKSLTFKDLTTKVYDKNRNKKYKEINIIQLPKSINKLPAFVKPTPVSTNGVRSQRITFKTLLNEYISTGNESFKDALQAMYCGRKEDNPYYSLSQHYGTQYSGVVTKEIEFRQYNIQAILFNEPIENEIYMKGGYADDWRDMVMQLINDVPLERSQYPI